MRAWYLVALLILGACSRKPALKAAVEPEIAPVNAVTGRTFVPADAPSHSSQTPYSSAPVALLRVWWTTVGEWFESLGTDGASLVLTSDGLVSHVEETPMRPWEKFSRYYIDEEAEKLFDSIIPSIERHAIEPNRRQRNHYFVRFVYQTPDGTFSHDCILSDLQPITSLLADLEARGRPEAPVGHPPVQAWARKRFDRFLPPRSPLEGDPAAALQIRTGTSLE